MRPMPLPARDIYTQEGEVSLGLLIEAAELEALRIELDAWAKDAPVNAYGLLYHNLWQVLPGFRCLVENGRLAQSLMTLLQIPEIRLFQDNLVCKLPGNPTEIQWHQDYSYWPLDRPAGITAWLALDDTDAENGAMWHIPGSHHWGERAPTDFIQGSKQPLLPGLPPMDPEGRPRMLASAQAGELRVHHPLNWHRSGPNLSHRPRRAWTTTWILPEVCWAPAHAPHPYLWSLSPEQGKALSDFPTFASATQTV